MKLLEQTANKIKDRKEKGIGKSIQRIWSDTKTGIKEFAIEERRTKLKQITQEKSSTLSSPMYSAQVWVEW